MLLALVVGTCPPSPAESEKCGDRHARDAAGCPLLLRLCCKSLFALVIKIFPGCRRDFRVKMWGTSSPDDKLTGDLGNVIEAAQIGVRRLDRLTTRKSSPGNFGLLQQYHSESDAPNQNANLSRCAINCREHVQQPTAYSITSSARARSVGGTVMPSALAVLKNADGLSAATSVLTTALRLPPALIRCECSRKNWSGCAPT
jgi:hypothetical protein